MAWCMTLSEPSLREGAQGELASVHIEAVSRSPRFLWDVTKDSVTDNISLHEHAGDDR